MFKEWITEIVVFVMIAAIIDLLIPVSSMQKYIRLVIGMILILIFLKPVFFLFNTDVEQVLIRGTKDWLEAEETNAGEKTAELQKKEIVRAQGAYISEQMAVQLKEQADPLLKQHHQAEIQDIQIGFQKGEQLTAEHISGVTVTLQEPREEGTVKQIDEVVIGRIPKQKDRTHDEAAIRTTLQKAWGLDPGQLTILWEGGTS